MKLHKSIKGCKACEVKVLAFLFYATSYKIGIKPIITEISTVIDVCSKQISKCLNAFRPLLSLKLGIGEEQET